MLKRRVVVTGMGAITPVGNEVASSWDNLVKGVSGVGPITRFDCSDFAVRIAAEVKELEMEQYFSGRDIKMELFMQIGIIAGMQAVEDAKLCNYTDLDKNRVGVSVGSGIGGITGIERGVKALMDRGPRRGISPYYIPNNIINLIPGKLSIMYGFRGPNISIVTACTTGTHNIGNAARMIEYGDVDVMLAGGVEAGITPTVVAGFSAAKALSKNNVEPTKASRPWDCNRDGFVIGEGAGAIVLESYEHAKKRNAFIYAELIGYGASADASHITAPDENGEGAVLCMQHAVQNAGIDSDQVDYINAHGTSTTLGDRAETMAIHRVFGSHAKDIAINSTKSMIGHLLGAAGAVEAIVAIKTIQHQLIHPTINLDNPGEGCDLDYVPLVARKKAVNVALSNSFGFGGTNGTLVFQRYKK